METKTKDSTVNFTEQFNKMLPKFENGFMRISFSKDLQAQMLIFCTLKENEAQNYLMSYEVVKETEDTFTIELEFSWSLGLLNSAYRFGHDWAQFIAK